jgi:uncharacterized membrane protein YdfJ with MMPL/SSD domain
VAGPGGWGGSAGGDPADCHRADVRNHHRLQHLIHICGARRRLRAGQTNPAATREAVREYLPVVLTAGIIVAAGVAALVVADSELFRAFGPGLAVIVLVGLLVAVVLTRCPR